MLGEGVPPTLVLRACSASCSTDDAEESREARDIQPLLRAALPILSSFSLFLPTPNLLAPHCLKGKG